MRNLSEYRRIADEQLAKRQHLVERVEEERQSLIEAEKELTHVQEAQQIVQALAQQIQRSAHDQIARVVSRCLGAIFDEPYQFRIHFERKRGKTEARLVFEREGREIDPKAVGGGVLDVAAFALRISCLLLSKPTLRRLIVMDEPFRFLKPPEYYGPRVVDLINTLSEELDLQFIIVQNVPEYRTGKVIELK